MNKMLHISIGSSRKDLLWRQADMSWADFLARLQTPVRHSITLAEYMGKSKTEQADLKDVGGFVGGTLRGGRRKAANVTGRDLVTLDLDHIEAGQTELFCGAVDALGVTAAVYSTAKHYAGAPRLRVIVPTDRTMTPEEYEPVARKLAEMIGIEAADTTTYEACRLMYWPSCCSDSEYVFKTWDGPMLSVEGVLALYADWHDVSSWPKGSTEDAILKRTVDKQQDPVKKKGWIGAFCRTYDIPSAIAKFLPGTYLPSATPGRYTYAEGSTVGGAVVYDGGKFLYSHHSTDPCSGLLVNAFDMVRIHLFGEKDADAKPDTPTNRMPSYAAMCELAAADPETVKRVDAEEFGELSEAFKDPVGAAEKPVEGFKPSEPTNTTDWRKTPARNAEGKLKCTVNNIMLLWEHDPATAGGVATDDFAHKGIVLHRLPWDPEGAPDKVRIWRDADDAGLRWYMEAKYGLTGVNKIADAIDNIGNLHRINRVKDYLEGLKWDGVARLDTLFVDYMGAEDNAYTRTAARLTMRAAVARACEDNVKFDYMPVIVGPQGCGKSTFVRLLGKDWCLEGLSTFGDKESMEQIQGKWIVEVGELAALSKADDASAKQFISKVTDSFRAPYGRRTEDYPRRCVFIGTVNDTDFLRDTTGNRRYWPIEVTDNRRKSVFTQLPGELDQIWAEAYNAYVLEGSEGLFLSGEALSLAQRAQAQHTEGSEREGLILDFVEMKVPDAWYEWDTVKKRMFMTGGMVVTQEMNPIKWTCAAEIWELKFGPLTYMKRSDAKQINDTLRKAGWKEKRARIGAYGLQRGYERRCDESCDKQHL